jgi:hypothetical protein
VVRWLRERAAAEHKSLGQVASEHLARRFNEERLERERSAAEVDPTEPDDGIDPRDKFA